MDFADIVLGHRYRDTVSGWTGTAVTRFENLDGRRNVELADRDKDGKPLSFTFGVAVLEPADGGNRRIGL